MFKQADRKATDGPVSVKRTPDGDGLTVTVTTDGVETSVQMSDYNASRVFGMLAIFLEIPLSKSVGKAIKM